MKENLVSFKNMDNFVELLSKDKIDGFFKEGKHCESRDIFQAQLNDLYLELRNPLLIAICGEIGNNSFDHNLGNWRDLSGVYFEHSKKENTIILADRGQGVRKTLSRIMPDISDDLEAVEIAFTKTISGRSPEQRGNGLKFVASAIKKNQWESHFQSGLGVAVIKNGNLSFSESSHAVKGCLAVVKY